MKQYKIVFFANKEGVKTSVYYMEFETITELKKWAVSVLHDDSFYCRYSHKPVSISEFLENT